MMANSSFFSSDFLAGLSEKLCNILPEQVVATKDDIEKNFKAILQASLNKLELVTREEFDTQTKVLARTREKLERLSQQLTELETKLRTKGES